MGKYVYQVEVYNRGEYGERGEWRVASSDATCDTFADAVAVASRVLSRDYDVRVRIQNYVRK